MKILTTESKLWWLSVADEIRPIKGIAVIDAVKALMEEFQFGAGPQGLPGPTEGYKFLEGATVVEGNRVAIKEVNIFNDGISVDVYSNTDDLKEILEKVLTSVRRIGLREPVTPPNIVFNSRITCELEGDISTLISPYAELSKTMAEIFGAGPSEVKTIDFQMDPKNGPPLNPTGFKIERRADIEYSQKRYYSFANTTTPNHVRLLELVDQLAR